MVEGYGREKHWPQILAVVIAGLAAITNGIFFNWFNLFIVQILKDREKYNFTLHEAAKLPLINIITAMITCPIFSKLSDVYGRKRILLLIAITDLAAWILKATASSICPFYLARFFVGLSHSIMFSTLPSYVGEVSSPKIRGTWGNSWTFFFTLGNVLATVVGSYYNIQETCYLFIPIPIVFFLSFLCMPESPYYYIMTGNHSQAKKSLRTLKRKENVESEFLVIEADIKRHMSEKAIWKDLVAIKRNRKALTAGIFLNTSQIFGEVSVFGLYSRYYFEKSNGISSLEESSMIFNGINLVVIIVACFLVDMLGRRKALIGSLVPCGTILLLESIYFYILQEQPDVELSSFGWTPTIGMVLHKIFNSFGLGMVPTLMIAELFSTSIKARALSILLILWGLLAFVLSYSFLLMDILRLYAPLLFFGVCNIFSAIVVYFVVPETKGKTLEQIQESLDGKNRIRTSRNIT